MVLGLLALSLAANGGPCAGAATCCADAREIWALSLADATRIGLENSEVVRVLSLGAQGTPVGGFEGEAPNVPCPARHKRGRASASPHDLAAHQRPIVIARLNADASLGQFKAEVMALVRSIEQQYWNLAQQHVQLFASEKAVDLAEEILKREQSDLEVGRGTVADVAEAQQRLEQFRLDVVAKTSDVLTTERQFRNILGLPPEDDRRIVPDTAPSEARVEPDWPSCLDQMLKCQPDIVQAEGLVQIAEIRLAVVRGGFLPLPVLSDEKHKLLEDELARPLPAPQDFLGMRLSNHTACTRQAQYGLLRQLANRQQVVHQSVHSLARFFLEVDASYKQFQAASRLRAAAAQRLEAQWAFYEEGRITVDRYLDAVSQYASALAQEAQFKTTYNISILALEEAKGTLLASNDIVVQDEPARPSARDWLVTLREFLDGSEGRYQIALYPLRNQAEPRETRTALRDGQTEPAALEVSEETKQVLCTPAQAGNGSCPAAAGKKSKTAPAPQIFTVRIPVNGSTLTLRIEATTSPKPCDECDGSCCEEE
jgi:hypothetical protein